MASPGAAANAATEAEHVLQVGFCCLFENVTCHERYGTITAISCQFQLLLVKYL